MVYKMTEKISQPLVGRTKNSFRSTRARLVIEKKNKRQIYLLFQIIKKDLVVSLVSSQTAKTNRPSVGSLLRRQNLMEAKQAPIDHKLQNIRKKLFYV